MQKILATICAAAIFSAAQASGELPSPEKALSLFPADPGYKITYNGDQKATAENRNGILELRRKEFTKVPGLRWSIKFSPELNLAEFPSAATLKLRVRGGEKNVEYQLAAYWHFGDPRGAAGRRILFRGGPEWQELELPVSRRSANGNLVKMLLLQFDPIGEFDVEKIQLGEKRPVSVELASRPEEAAGAMTLRGRTAKPDADVTLKLTDASGHKTARTVKAKDGQYEFTWDNPPLSVQKYNTLTASTGAAEMSLPLPVFGYRKNYDFAWLKTKGPRIVTSKDAEGGEQPFIPIGIGYARDVIMSNLDDGVMEFSKARGLNTIRLPMYTRFFNNNRQEPIDLDAHIRDFIDPVVQAAKRHDMYVILDDHGYFSEKIDEAKARDKQATALWNDDVIADWAARWKKIAEYYKDEPHVLGYELMNEPHDIRPETARNWYTRAIKEIRKVDQKHIIIVGSADWSHARSMEKTWGEVAATADAPYNNLVFAFHDYPEDNHPWIVKEHVLKFRDAHQVPVLCTEFGATHWNKGETVCREFQAGMLAFCAESETGWMIWALKQLADSPRAPFNEVDKVGFGPPIKMDSCSYSDLWVPVAKTTAPKFPKPAKE